MKDNRIETKRLVLIGLKENHADAVVGFRQQQEVYQYFKNPKKITLEEHLHWYRNNYLQDGSRYDFVISLAEEEHTIIGTCGISDLNTKEKTMEVSYLLSPQYRGNGYAREAIEALINYGKGLWHIKEVMAVVHKENEKSLHFIENMGFLKKQEDGKFTVFGKEV